MALQATLTAMTDTPDKIIRAVLDLEAECRCHKTCPPRDTPELHAARVALLQAIGEEIEQWLGPPPRRVYRSPVDRVRERC